MCNNCGIFKQGVIDQIFANQLQNTQVAYNTNITVTNGLTVVKTTTTDASGNVTESFALSNQVVGAWIVPTVGASGVALTVAGRRALQARIERWTQPSISAGEQKVIRLSGTYGYVSPTINVMEHLFTLDTDHRPAVRHTFPIVCYGVDLASDIVGYATGIAEVRENGEVHAMFTTAVPGGSDAYAIEMDVTYPTES